MGSGTALGLVGLGLLLGGCRTSPPAEVHGAPARLLAGVVAKSAVGVVDAGEAGTSDCTHACNGDGGPGIMREQRADVGPHELTMLPGRSVWYALPRYEDAHRLIAHLHGQCAPPVYSCGEWIDAGTERGLMVCPTGNAHCNDSGMGPAMWDESFRLMDQDLEKGIAVVTRKLDGGVARDDEVLTGFSRGGWAAIQIVRRHPGRWPHLVIVEADVTITRAILDAAKVRSVAMVAGEWGTERAGEEKSVEALKATGYPAELFVMPKTAHLYSEDIDEVMGRALDFVLREGRAR